MAIMIRGSEPNNQLTQEYIDRLSDEHIISMYPFLEEGWTELEIPGDVHSLMLTYYASLGWELNYLPIIDRKIYDKAHRKVTTGDERKNTAPLADSAWYTKDSFTLRCLVEFQRWKGTTKSRHELIKKAKNLVLYDDMRRSLDLLVLHHWDSSNVGLPEEVTSILQNGFTDDHGVSYSRPDADIVIVKSRFDETEIGVKLQYTTINEIIPGVP